MTLLRPIINPELPPTGDMLDALTWLETAHRMREIAKITEGEARAFLRDEEGRPDLAEAFSPLFLLPIEPR